MTTIPHGAVRAGESLGVPLYFYGGALLDEPELLALAKQHENDSLIDALDRELGPPLAGLEGEKAAEADLRARGNRRRGCIAGAVVRGLQASLAITST